jgi:phospholipid/cholesterol/gamma-HCH transport system ATP-binding protein
MIEIKDIYKTFGDNDVLKGISATFQTGKNNLIIGGSGSGKTTLLKMYCRLARAYQRQGVF